MDPQSLLSIEVACWAITACFGVAGLALRMRDAFQTDEQRRATAQWYGGKWETIRRTGVLRLPEAVIEWLLRVKGRLAQVIRRVECGVPDWAGWSLIGIICAASIAGPWIVFGRWWAGVALAVPSVAAALEAWIGRKRARRLPRLLVGALFGVAIAACLLGLACLLKVLLTFSTLLAALVLLGLSPVFGLGLGALLLWGAALVGEVRGKGELRPEMDLGFLVGLTMTASFCVTLCSLLIGHVVRPDAPVPQTLQMLFSNVVCDGLTMLATVLILGAAVGPKRRFPVPVAILLDLALAVVLACASLWCGLVRTENALSVTQVARVLIGQSPSGTQFQFGPYFWAMHTTFLPTLLYLSLIALCWLAKLVVLPVALVLQKGRVVEKPHHASAVTLLLVAAIFAALAKGLAYLRSYATVPGP